LIGPLQSVGLGLADAISFTVQSFFLLAVFRLGISPKMEGINKISQILHSLAGQKSTWITLLRTLLGSAVGAAVILLVNQTASGWMPNLILGLLAAGTGIIVTFPFIYKEFRILLRL